MAGMEKKLEELKARLREVNDLNNAGAVLYWDQATYMPPGGAEARGRQMATLARIAQERFTAPEVGRLIDDLLPYAGSLPPDSDDGCLVRAADREYRKAVRVPADFLAAFSEHSALSYQVWTEARSADDFKRILPLLEKTLDLSRRLADFFPGYDHIADPLIDFSDYGMKAGSVRKVFGELREQLVPLVRAAASRQAADDSCLKGHFPKDRQLDFGKMVIGMFGYDFARGRQDLTHHPFETRFSVGDVRITTRIDEGDFACGFFSTTHESGHALYEQGVDPALEGTLLAEGTSSGVHESQSRTWENLVSRSMPFWEHFYPELQKVFPDRLGTVPLETFYRAVNRVEPSLIRTEADELTYNLHVMIRFELELKMLEGRLEVKDLPEAWNAAYQENLGIAPENDADGCLQDVHWFGGHIGGAFQGYTLGNILSAQFFAEALKALPGIHDDMRRGSFSALHGWLRENIYRHGSKYTAPELIERVTGRGLDIGPYIRYLREKYGEL
ncbi:carboxypeptidase M32 [Aminivibrio sp.]|jgi:carboxypeptidase Taq|uniref:carboxypeptidase M32 n=1 Tax=Aminivibrio sp. TaxID=1872489 RepID=UPI001A5E155E|nr:carboxypeptidase M32 [Aminivibrio sp.]MBL3540298.1 carboxypeptidase M32 [Aminivibrio sp.]MDK2959363.1 carboxypeptidase Taq [Synergistaceae bacterium]